MVPDDCYLEYFAHISKQKDEETGEYIVPVKFYSISHVNGYVSAIKYYYNQQCGRKMPETLYGGCNKVLKGFTRKIEKMKTTGEIPMHEGKAPLSFEAYKFLGEQTTKLTEDFSLAAFAHLFLLLCWNLIARCVSVATAIYHGKTTP